MAICSACEAAADTFFGSDKEYKEDVAQAIGAYIKTIHNHTCSDASGCPCNCEESGNVAAAIADSNNAVYTDAPERI